VSLSEVVMKPGTGEWNKYFLAWIIVFGFISITVYLLHLVHSGKQIADTTGSVFMLLGAWQSLALIIANYFFGSKIGRAHV